MKRLLITLLSVGVYAGGASAVSSYMIFPPADCERKRLQCSKMERALFERDWRSRTYGAVVFWPFYLAGRTVRWLDSPRSDF